MQASLCFQRSKGGLTDTLTRKKMIKKDACCITTGSELTTLWSGAEQEEQEDEHRRRQPTADSGTAASHDLAESAPVVASGSALWCLL
jgi:hypothetical protein